jgi:hypothetical protein
VRTSPLVTAALCALMGCGATSVRAPVVAPAPVAKVVATIELEHEEVVRPRRVVVTETSIVVLGDIHFVEDSTAIAPESNAMIDAVASLYFGGLLVNKLQCVVYIGEGVVADRDERLRLALDRSHVIIEELVERGVDRDRLVAGAQIDTAPATNPAWIILDRGL